MGKAPTSVVVISIIGLVLGALGFLGLVWAVFVTFVGLHIPNPILDALGKDPIYLGVTGVSLALAFPMTIVSIASCIGSLSLRPWARKGLLIYAWFAIVQAVFGTLFNVVYVFPKMQAAMPARGAPGAGVGMMGGMIGGICGGVLGVVFPICIIYFYNRPHVKDAFNGIFPHSPTNFPVEFPNQPGF